MQGAPGAARHSVGEGHVASQLYGVRSSKTRIP